MAMRYDRLFRVLAARGHSFNYWLRKNGLHSATVTKLRKNEYVSMDTLNTLCKILNCQPSNIMEYVDDEPIAPPKLSKQETTPR